MVYKLKIMNFIKLVYIRKCLYYRKVGLFILKYQWEVLVVSMFMINNACSAPLPPLPKYKRLFILVSGGGQGGSCICLFVSKFLFRCFWLVVVQRVEMSLVLFSCGTAGRRAAPPCLYCGRAGRLGGLGQVVYEAGALLLAGWDTLFISLQPAHTQLSLFL